jgi:hypothetical protein
MGRDINRDSNIKSLGGEVTAISFYGANDASKMVELWRSGAPT